MEQSTIFFRSRKIRPHTGGVGGQRRRGRGTDILDIGVYNPGDDIRDISWVHTARHGSLEKKIREEESNFPIVVVDLIGDNQYFTLSSTVAVSDYKDRLKELLTISAKKHHMTSRVMGDIRIARQIHDSQVFVLYHMDSVADMDFMRGLSLDNDIIPIEILHPYELNPHQDIIIEGYSIDRTRYRELFIEREESKKKYFSKLKIEGLTLTTDMNPVITINQFLKNRI